MPNDGTQHGVFRWRGFTNKHPGKSDETDYEHEQEQEQELNKTAVRGFHYQSPITNHQVAKQR